MLNIKQIIRNLRKGTPWGDLDSKKLQTHRKKRKKKNKQQSKSRKRNVIK